MTGVVDVLVRALWATYRYLHPEEFPHTPEPEAPPPLIPGVAPTDPEAFLPEVLAEAAGVIERKAESTDNEKRRMNRTLTRQRRIMPADCDS